MLGELAVRPRAFLVGCKTYLERQSASERVPFRETAELYRAFIGIAERLTCSNDDLSMVVDTLNALTDDVCEAARRRGVDIETFLAYRDSWVHGPSTRRQREANALAALKLLRRIEARE